MQKINKSEVLATIYKKEIDEFVESSRVLFETLHNRTLVKKIIEIVQYLIKQMKKRPDLYSKTEIRGLEIGFEIIEKGDYLFEQLPERDQSQIFEFIIQIEKDVLERLFEE